MLKVPIRSLMKIGMRLDLYLFEMGLVSSRTEAKNFILEGAVSVGGKIIKKPSFDVLAGTANVTVDVSAKKYASRAGFKLEAALDSFSISPRGLCAVDIGASSGGFTDCLLQRGALRVAAVDSGYGQLVTALRDDPRVDFFENYNARYMSASDFDFVPDIAVMDVSFISATYIIPVVAEVLRDNGIFVCLIKPQFEVGKAHIGKGGIVKNEKHRREAVDKVVRCAEGVGFLLCSLIESPITGGDGNVEYLAYLRKKGG